MLKDVTKSHLSTISVPGDAPATFPEPMGVDQADDEVVRMTRRGLARIALVATEAGARFERHGSEADAMEWMLRPTPLFGGRAALDACAELDACSRGVLLHMFDVDPEADVEELDRAAFEQPFDDDEDEDGAERLFSCMVAYGGEDRRTWTFDAFVATGVGAAHRVLASRHGAALAAQASIVEGFDVDDPYVVAMVSPALADAIRIAAADPTGRIARGLDVSVVQRIAA